MGYGQFDPQYASMYLNLRGSQLPAGLLNPDGTSNTEPSQLGDALSLSNLLAQQPLGFPYGLTPKLEGNQQDQSLNSLLSQMSSIPGFDLGSLSQMAGTLRPEAGDFTSQFSLPPLYQTQPMQQAQPQQQRREDATPNIPPVNYMSAPSVLSMPSTTPLSQEHINQLISQDSLLQSQQISSLGEMPTPHFSSPEPQETKHLLPEQQPHLSALIEQLQQQQHQFHQENQQNGSN